MTYFFAFLLFALVIRMAVSKLLRSQKLIKLADQLNTHQGNIEVSKDVARKLRDLA